jgi:hypothetical protein
MVCLDAAHGLLLMQVLPAVLQGAMLAAVDAIWAPKPKCGSIVRWRLNRGRACRNICFCYCKSVLYHHQF